VSGMRARKRLEDELLDLEARKRVPMMKPSDAVAEDEPLSVPSAEPEVLRSGLLAVDPETRASLVLQLQTRSGNATVERQIARAPSPEVAIESPEESSFRSELEAALQEPATEPHGGEGGTDILKAIVKAAEEAGEAVAEVVEGAVEGVESMVSAIGRFFGFGDAEQAQSPAGGGPTTTTTPTTTPTPAPAEDPAVTTVKDWSAKALTTNAEYAQWILDADTHGFVHWTGKDSKSQMEKLAKGEKVASADPKQAKILGGIAIIRDLIRAKTGKWIGDPTKEKGTVAIGSFLRSTDAHGSGRMIDINELDWNGKDGPTQVADALGALTPGKYGIGMPFQGEFFPRDQWLVTRQTKAKAAAKDKDPDPVTDPSLVKWTNRLSTATWNPDKKNDKGDPAPGWDAKGAGGSAFDHIKSAELKKAIKDLNADKGFEIYVFPDNDNHIHIQSP
jgi:hypothetical protein